MNLDTPERDRGGFKVTPMRNGNLPVCVHFYGFMENVGISYPYFLRGFLKLMITAFEAGAGKSVIWCENISIFRFESSRYSLVLRSSKTSAPCRNPGSHHSLSFIATSGTIKRRAGAGYSHHSWSSFANSPTRTPPFFPISIWPIVVARNTQATPSY